MQDSKANKRGRPIGRPRKTRRGPRPHGYRSVGQITLDVGSPEECATNQPSQEPEVQVFTQNTTEPMTVVIENVATPSSAEHAGQESPENGQAYVPATPVARHATGTRGGRLGRPRGHRKCLTLQEEDRRMRDRGEYKERKREISDRSTLSKKSK